MKNLLLLLSFLALPVTHASEMNMDHHNHSKMMPEKVHSEPKAEMNPPSFMHHQNLNGRATDSAQAYAHINHTMHENMNIDFTGNPDIDFLEGMIPHHQGAVDMANIQLEYGNDGTLKHLTNRIIRDQKREILIMNRLLLGLKESENTSKKSVWAFKFVNRKMHMKMNIKYTGNADIDFVNGMIPHHQGAVDMAKVVIKYGESPNVRRLAYDIINAQESEISWMKRWNQRYRLMNIRR